ncbi:MAG: acyl-CoA dehydrogenase family protein, partial [Sciscionella sp.]
MRFALSQEQRQFSASVSDMLGSADTPSAARAWGEGEHEPGLRIWRQLAELGLTALAVGQEHGGLDAEPVDLVVALEQCGYHAVCGPLVEALAVVPILLRNLADDDLAAQWLPRLAAGEALATIALPPHVPYALDADIADLVLAGNADGALQRLDGGGIPPQRSVDVVRRL